MRGRIIPGILLAGLFAGCGGEEPYNTLPPEPQPPAKVSTKPNTRKVTKPPAAPKQQHMPMG